MNQAKETTVLFDVRSILVGYFERKGFELSQAHLETAIEEISHEPMIFFSEVLIPFQSKSVFLKEQIHITEIRFCENGIIVGGYIYTKDINNLLAKVIKLHR